MSSRARGPNEDRYLSPKDERVWQGEWEAEKAGLLIEQRDMTPLEEALRDAIEALPELYRDVVLMYDYERLSYREIAVRMSVAGVATSHETARRYHEVAKRKLKGVLEDTMREEE